jgi:hypothetical protein
MQISRHWRMKAIRYRLQGLRVNRADSEQLQKQAREPQREPVLVKRAAAAAR